jgi:ATPase subunit of ABC transporter with duplicated ATPase domains
VALCRMMLTPANILILDEPTNHLDISAKEVLETALQHFQGAVIVISHDRCVNYMFVCSSTKCFDHTILLAGISSAR